MLVPAIVVSWVLLTHLRASAMPDDVFARDGHSFYLPFVSAVLFVVSWGLAIWRRRTPPLHARYMVGTGLAAIDAVTARLVGFNLPPFENPLIYQVIGFGLTNALLIGLWLIDRGPYRRAFLHLLLVFAPLHLFWFTGAQSAQWLAVVAWFRGFAAHLTNVVGRMMRWVLVILAWLVAVAVLGPVIFFVVIVLAGPHSSMLPSAIQPAVLVIGWVVFLRAPCSWRDRCGAARR